MASSRPPIRDGCWVSRSPLRSTGRSSRRRSASSACERCHRCAHFLAASPDDLRMAALDRLDVVQLVALAAAIGWASGIRLYAVLFIVGALGFLHWVDLPSGLQLLAHPWVLAASGF